VVNKKFFAAGRQKTAKHKASSHTSEKHPHTSHMQHWLLYAVLLLRFSSVLSVVAFDDFGVSSVRVSKDDIKHKTFSTVQCDMSLGPTCAFTNVCVQLNKDQKVNLVHLPLKESARIPYYLATTVERIPKWLWIPLGFSQVDSLPEVDFVENGVLGALYGPENFGHELMDGKRWFTLIN
jgi:hypothetical protein